MEILYDTGNLIASAEDYKDQFGMIRVGLTPSSSAKVVWCWEEDASSLDCHDSSTILPDTSFIAYPSDISEEIERQYQLNRHGDLEFDVSSKMRNVHTGCTYEIDFLAMVQTNSLSGYSRQIRRELHFKNDIYEDEKKLPILPLKKFGQGEQFLPTFRNQVVRVTKRMSNRRWCYGEVVYDPVTNGPRTTDENAPNKGWFPAIFCKRASASTMQNALNSAVASGAENAINLAPPATWDASQEGLVVVPGHSNEYREVAQYFLESLEPYQDKNTILRVERIQSSELWKSYAVKTEAMKTRYLSNPGSLVNNTDTDRLEMKWLFHGTKASSVPKILSGGFNRAFAGLNAAYFGKGVYFARNASYSWKFSPPDSQDLRRMFLCRVGVGDYCEGTQDALTPDPKPDNPHAHFDSTVDDVDDPSIFVAYHDAQAYPEYLITYRRKN